MRMKKHFYFFVLFVFFAHLTLFTQTLNSEAQQVNENWFATIKEQIQQEEYSITWKNK